MSEAACAELASGKPPAARDDDPRPATTLVRGVPADPQANSAQAGRKPSRNSKVQWPRKNPAKGEWA